MITGSLRSQIDKLWTEFWTGGIANPITVIEQITYLMFIRLLDINEQREEKKAQRTGKPPKGMFSAKQQHLRWSSFKKLGADEMLVVVRDEVFPHVRNLGKDGTTFGEYLKDAQFLIVKPSLLVSAVNMMDALPLTEGDTKGDLYEYLLSKLTTAGINGQFRSPRHIIRMMVELVDPKPTERIGDPACGTAGFLVAVMQYLLEKNTSPAGIIEHEGEDGQKERIFTGDKLEPYRSHIQKELLHGFDFDVTMLRIAAMNLMLHGIREPRIHYQDTLSNSFLEHHPQQASDYFDVILANPPFKGSLDESSVQPSLLARVKTRKTELLFVTLMLRMLKLGGRCAVIVPDGVLFGSSKAHLALRTMLVEQNQLEAIVSLPAGVFKPYAGVSTAVLVFTKGGTTEHVWFYDVEADGFSLDDKRTPIEANDIPDVIARWPLRDPQKPGARTDKAFLVPADEIRENDYDLSINKYKETVYEEVKYDPPKVILAQIRNLEAEIAKDIGELEEMLK